MGFVIFGKSKRFSRFMYRYRLYIAVVLCIVMGIFTPILYTGFNLKDMMTKVSYDVSAKLFYFLEKPIAYIYKFKCTVHDYTKLQEYQENIAVYRSQVKTLHNTNKSLELENRELRALLALNGAGEELITVPCFGQYAKLNTDSLFIKAGCESGVARYDVILSEGTIIGQVDEVGGQISRVLLITDPTSNIPVFCEKSEQEGIISGNKDGLLKLKFVRNSKEVIKGELIFSSGVDGHFPRGKLIGVVHTIDGDEISVLPQFIAEKLRYVQVYRSSVVNKKEGCLVR